MQGHQHRLAGVLQKLRCMQFLTGFVVCYIRLNIGNGVCPQRLSRIGYPGQMMTPDKQACWGFIAAAVPINKTNAKATKCESLFAQAVAIGSSIAPMRSEMWALLGDSRDSQNWEDDKCVFA
jgi:hypothetical protein